MPVMSQYGAKHLKHETELSVTVLTHLEQFA